MSDTCETAYLVSSEARWETRGSRTRSKNSRARSFFQYQKTAPVVSSARTRSINVRARGAGIGSAEPTKRAEGATRAPFPFGNVGAFLTLFCNTECAVHSEVHRYTQADTARGGPESEYRKASEGEVRERARLPPLQFVASLPRSTLFTALVARNELYQASTIDSMSNESTFSR